MTAGQRVTAFRLMLAIALAVSITFALVPAPPTVLADWSDKSRHILAFATLAVLAAHAYPQARLYRIGERLSFLGAIIEMLQAIPALQRDCDIVDWLADTAAVAVVLLAVAAVRRARAAT